MNARGAPTSIPKDLGALFAFATASHARALAFLLLVSLVAFLPGFFNIPPTDRDEARFAQATKQMIESGDYIDIRYQDEVRYKKPVGIYWLQASVVRAAEAVGVPQARTTIWLYRIPSLLGAIGAVLLTYWVALAFVSRRTAYLAGLMMATSVLLTVEARLAKTDAMLLLCCVAAMGVMARAYLAREDRANPAREDRANPAREDRANPARADRANPAREDRASPAREDRANPAREDRANPARADRANPARADRPNPARRDRAKPAQADRDIPWRHALILWTALAAGILLKGPLILMVVGLAVLALAIADRSAHWLMRLRPLVGVLWVLLLVLPWFLAIMLRAGDSFLQESVGQDLIAKIFKGQETHGAPPGYYLLLFWLTFWPAAPLAAVAAPAIWRNRREPQARFLLAWLVPAWIVFELVITKLPHYVLPLYPAIAILIAREIERRALSQNVHLVRFNVMWPIFAAVLPAGVIIALIYARGQFGWLAWPFAALSAIFGFYAWRLYDVEGAERSYVRASTGALFLFVAALGVAVPLLRPIFPSRGLAELIGNAGCRNPVVASAGYHEPSLVFLAGTRTRLVDGAGAAEILRQGECRIAVIESRHERAFAQRAERIGLRYSLRGRLDNSININGGRSITFAIYRSEPQQ